MNGYIKLHRRLTQHWLWTESKVFSKREAWIDLLLEANFAPSKRLIGGTVVQIKRGECIASQRWLASRWRWNRANVGKFIALLESENMVKSSAAGSQLTSIVIVNYEHFQGSDPLNPPAEPPAEPPPDPPADPLADPLQKKKQKKKQKNIEKENGGLIILDAELPHGSQAFLEAWNDYKLHRASMAKSKQLTRVSEKAALAKLGRWSESVAVEALTNSVANGWQGIFEPQQTAGGQRTSFEAVMNGQAEPRGPWRLRAPTDSGTWSSLKQRTRERILTEMRDNREPTI